jgi:hypothetical protein
MKGTIVNAVAIIAGTGIGLLLQRGIPERYKTTVMQGIAMAVALIGIQMAQKTENILIVIGSLAIGAVLGEWWDVDKRLSNLGKWIEQKCNAETGKISRGFVTCSLIYCVGAMAIVGAIQDGMTGNAEILYAKAMLDGVSAIIFASTLGVGVALSAIAVVVYQGIITVLASHIGMFITNGVIVELTATGGLLIVGIAISMLEIKLIKVANLLPSIFVSIVISLMLK